MAKRPKKKKTDDATVIDGEILPPESDAAPGDATGTAPPPPPKPQPRPQTRPQPQPQAGPRPQPQSKPHPKPRPQAVRDGGAQPPGPSKTRSIVTGAVTLAVIGLFIVAWFAWPGIERQIGDLLTSDIEIPVEAQPAPDTATTDDFAMLAGDIGTLSNRLDEFAARHQEILARVELLDDRIGALETMLAGAPSLADLAERVDAIERVGMSAASGGAVPAVDAARIDALEQEIAALKAGAETAGLEGRLVALEDVVESAGELTALLSAQAARVAALEELIGAEEDTRAAVLLAVGQLRVALRGSGAYEAELSAVRVVVPADDETAAAIDVLAAHAATGVATPETLRARFGAIAAEIVRAAYAPDEGSWLDQTVARLAELATLRRVGEVAGEEADARVARAETRLAEGDLAAAVAEVEGLAEAPGRVAADWLSDARARLATARALAVLDARALAAYAAPAGSG